MSCVVSDSRDPERLTVRTVAVPDTGDVLAGLPDPDVVAWVRRGSGLAGWGEAARVTLPSGEDRFTAGEKWLRALFDAAEVDDQVRTRGTGPVAFGTFTFDPSSDGSVLVVPRILRGRDGQGRAWLTTVTTPGTATRGTDAQHVPARGNPARGNPAQDDRTQDDRTQDDRAQDSPEQAPAGIRWHDGSLSAPHWEQAVAKAVTAIKANDPLRKVVLARDLYATATGPIDARVLLGRLAARYPECYTYACDGMVGASPELLIRRDGRQVSALVLAGTTPRGGSEPEDDALGAALLADAKNAEEHVYAVTSMRDSLEPLCETLDIEAHPVLLKLPNLQHLGTEVHGTLRASREAGKSALALAGAVHPTAAVCGTPTGAAMELIRELEQMDRERYAGPVGWVDADGNGEFAIALRCAQLSGNTARLFAGCGIVAGSVPNAELAEAQVKFRPMRNALDG
jgi:menaquinone-specific isochorismate synthase